jgi:hypothetical protein
MKCVRKYYGEKGECEKRTTFDNWITFQIKSDNPKKGDTDNREHTKIGQLCELDSGHDSNQIGQRKKMLHRC